MARCKIWLPLKYSPEACQKPFGEGSSDGRFCVADFVGTFAARLGLSLAAYDSMDQRFLLWMDEILHQLMCSLSQ